MGNTLKKTSKSSRGASSGSSAKLSKPDTSISKKLSEPSIRDVEKGSSSGSTTPKSTSPKKRSGSQDPGFSNKKIEELFLKYVDPSVHTQEDPLMQPEGVENFLTDLALEPEDVAVVVLSWYFKATTSCYYRKSEFIRGLQELKVDSIAKLQAKIPSLRNELMNNEALFQEIYEFSFLWSRDSTEKKFLDLETAIALQELMVGDRYPLSASFRDFLREQTAYKTMNKDQWQSALEFFKTNSSELENYDINGSWPTLLDEFVVWLKEKFPDRYKQDEDAQDRDEYAYGSSYGGCY